MIATTIAGSVLIVPSVIIILQQELSALAQPTGLDESKSANVLVIVSLLVLAPCLLPCTLIRKTTTTDDSMLFQVLRGSCEISLMIVVAVAVFVVAFRS